MLIVFDLDGTLIDSARDLAESASELVEALGAPAIGVAAVSEMVGDGAAALVRRALAHASLDPDTPGALARFLAIYDRRMLDHTAPYDGVREALALSLHLGPMAVLTNKPLAPSLGLLEALGLRGFFSDVLGGDGHHARKPDPAGLRSLMAAWPGQPVVMVGDSPADARTAEAAGCAFLLARYGFGVVRFDGELPRTPYVAGHARELPAVLARVSSETS